jgi:hypothetical protein
MTNLLAQHRPWEWELYDPLVGTTMLEFGNKKKAGGELVFTYKDVFQELGFRHVSVDLNGKDGAIAKDLGKPLKFGQFDMVTNIGTSEHVHEQNRDGQVACWRNMLEAMHVDSVLLSITPEPGSWPKHGAWYPGKEFYRELAALNGLELEKCYNSDERKPGCHPQQRNLFARLRRVTDVPFQMPAKGMFKNR